MNLKETLHYLHMTTGHRTHFGIPLSTPVVLLIGLYEVFRSDFMMIGKVLEGVMTLRSAKDE